MTSKKKNIKHIPKKLSSKPQGTPLSTWARAGIYTLGAFACVAVAGVGYFVVTAKQIVRYTGAVPVAEVTTMPAQSLQFPVGVDPVQEEIIENPIVQNYFDEHVASKDDTQKTYTGWFSRALGKLALMGWYQNLASASSRILVIESGERKEQVAEHFGKILGWDRDKRASFVTLISSKFPSLEEGKFFPGNYSVAKGATPEDVAALVTARFNDEVLSRYGEDIESVVPLRDTLTIASLLEREAYDFEDMRLISGVIWNRLFVDMKLQIDATLQYAKGSKPTEPWWPRVRPVDKYIASVYNTYENKGLPPAPIANPSLDAILAALNPRKTECMYYFHDREAEFHCAETYEEHVALLKQYYGRGK